MSRRSWRLSSSACLATVLLAGCTSGGDDPAPVVSTTAVTLQVGTPDDSSRPSGRAIMEFAAQLAALSGGKLLVKAVWEAAPPEARAWDQTVAERVISGDLEMGVIPARSWDTEGVTTFQALQAPYLVDSDALLDQVAVGDTATEMLAGLNGHGVKGLTLIPEGLRHPFGFAEPLVAPADFAGKTIRTPRSKSGYAQFEALGAKPDDLTGDAVTEALDDGSLAGYDNGYALSGNLPAKATATGNLTLFPKINVLVVNQQTFDKLPADQQAVLAEAATRTRDKMIPAREGDVAQGEKFCASGGKVVVTTASRLREFEKTAEPLYADLRRDPVSGKLLTEIQALKAKAGAGPAVTPCGK
jgi:TRAP-type C4-dicarboxylate transport system substrate-binding protein